MFAELTSRAGRTGGLEAVLGRGGSRCRDFEARAWRGSLRKSREAKVAGVKGMGQQEREGQEAFRSQGSGWAGRGLGGTYTARGQHAWDQKQLFLLFCSPKGIVTMRTTMSVIY